MITQQTRYFRVERRDLVYLKFILEAYEGLATLTTVEKGAAVVRITSPSGFAAELDALIDALGRETPLHETASPTL